MPSHSGKNKINDIFFQLVTNKGINFFTQNTLITSFLLETINDY